MAAYPLIDEFFQNTDFDLYAEFGGFDISGVSSMVENVPKLPRNEKFYDLVMSFIMKISNDKTMASQSPEDCPPEITGFRRIQNIYDNLDKIVAEAGKTSAWEVLPNLMAPLGREDLFSRSIQKPVQGPLTSADSLLSPPTLIPSIGKNLSVEGLDLLLAGTTIQMGKFQ